MESFKKIFSGRLNRQTWFFCLLLTQIIFIVALGIVFMLSNFLAALMTGTFGEVVMRWSGGLSILFLAGVGIVIILSLHARRLHDLGKSAHWLLLLLIPFVNGLLLIYLLVRKGQTGSNQYGDESFKKSGLVAIVFNRH